MKVFQHIVSRVNCLSLIITRKTGQENNELFRNYDVITIRCGYTLFFLNLTDLNK